MTVILFGDYHTAAAAESGPENKMEVVQDSVKEHNRKRDMEEIHVVEFT